MTGKLHDHEDFAPLWSTFNSQRLLGVGITSLAFAPLVQNAREIWVGSGQGFFLFAIAFLVTSILLAQASLRAQRLLAIDNASYANLRRKKELTMEIIDKQGFTDEWRRYMDELNGEDKDLAKTVAATYKSLESWLWAQYSMAIFGSLAMILAIITTPL